MTANPRSPSVRLRQQTVVPAVLSYKISGQPAQPDELAGAMLRSLYLAARERRWNRDRRRRINEMLERERGRRLAETPGLSEEMAIQLAEIWALPEAPQPR
jgi:hypothetical protein